MNAVQWLEVVSLGIIFGALGQGARTIVGIKKLNDYSTDANATAALIDGVRLLISFGIGGVAGAFAAVTLITDITKAIPLEQLFAIAASGYTGSDFIEGFMSRISGNPSNPTGTGASANASSDDAVG
jgi:putative chitinase